jgi:hypothetical protein
MMWWLKEDSFAVVVIITMCYLSSDKLPYIIYDVPHKLDH